MLYGRLIEDIKGDALIKDNNATRCLPQAREITYSEYLKIRKGNHLGRKVKFIFKEHEVKRVALDLALFLVSKYPSVVLLNDDLREIASVDVLETLSRQEIISLYAFACKEYMGRPMNLGETSLKNVEMILTLRKLAMNNNILISDMIDKSRGNSGS
jgi:hypothetical protein